ncbi:unnamed protein product, partial [marine sediment metagenome]
MEQNSAFRTAHIALLNEHLENNTTAQLLIQSEVLAGLSEGGQVPMSEAQANRLFNQTLATRNWLQALEAHHPEKDVLECAEVAHAAIGYGEGRIQA